MNILIKRGVTDHSEKILVIDVCPQANLSELLLGGLHQGGSNILLQRQGATPRATIGGYFQLRLPSPYTPPSFTAQDFLTQPYKYNKNISFAVGGLNIFNAMHSKWDRTISSGGGYFYAKDGLLPYSQYSPMGFSGGYYYIKASVKF